MMPKYVTYAEWLSEKDNVDGKISREIAAQDAHREKLEISMKTNFKEIADSIKELIHVTSDNATNYKLMNQTVSEHMKKEDTDRVAFIQSINSLRGDMWKYLSILAIAVFGVCTFTLYKVDKIETILFTGYEIVPAEQVRHNADGTVTNTNPS